MKNYSNSKRQWTEKEEMQLFELYDQYKDSNGIFHAYKVKDDELIGGRTINAVVTRLRNEYEIVCELSPGSDDMPKKKTHSAWTTENQLDLLWFVNENISAETGQIAWRNWRPDSVSGNHSKRACERHWQDFLKPKCHFNTRRNNYVCPELTKQKLELMKSNPPKEVVIETPPTNQVTVEVADPTTKREFVTVVKTYLWGAFKVETTRSE